MTETKPMPELKPEKRVCKKCGERCFEFASKTSADDHTCLSCL